MHTRSDVKWLINEAAALAGELERLDRELSRLAARRETVHLAHSACVQTLAYVTERPSLPGLPVVHAHRAYGGRGRLREFLQTVLREAAPQPFTTAELATRVIEHFGLQFSCPKELYDFKVNSVARALQKLQAVGLIDRVATEESAGRALGAWQWKQALPALSKMGVAPGGGTNREQ